MNEEIAEELAEKIGSLLFITSDEIKRAEEYDKILETIQNHINKAIETDRNENGFYELIYAAGDFLDKTPFNVTPTHENVRDRLKTVLAKAKKAKRL